MKQEFNWAMDQVKLPPEAEARILRVLEDRRTGLKLPAGNTGRAR